MKPLGDTLLVATHNAGKLEEFAALFAPLGIGVKGARAFDLPEPEETETTFLGNARIKARAAMEATGLPTLADDSGIEVDALGGAPGVYTADWAETPAGRDFMQAMERTHRELEARGAAEPRTARFRCTLVLLWPDGEEAVFEGAVEGRVTWPPRGLEGHGYDPIFVPDGHDITMGEMTFEQKNALSHRAAALAKLKAALDDA
ncbi:RdgB/HAM1 family non-canonical purine NTP pyrophosphatase [Jannaschia aquimarina]|uniref:dITP/XTP pyrophosphatase n=1 Tax=Jannaschia aquimarina TaxID=935700 RepID=A0A0D1EB42_9RHOB|nr:RdgB/HAM1 family non-canonical purine NTP pyrophosphatase [Jannaschia aquimarina]KIT14974.1 Non-canonical purine NTP pyrophosphatase [Jannaschia aquimarina]SNS60932.1 dITPase [Jannaschia aquimarina]